MLATVIATAALLALPLAVIFAFAVKWDPAPPRATSRVSRPRPYNWQSRSAL